MTVGVIGDTHLPFEHPLYLDFIQRTFKRYKVNKVVHIGDLVDNHAISYHEADPDGMSPGDEGLVVDFHLDEWKDAFKKMTVLMGNHDKLPERKVRSQGLSQRFLRGFKEIWDLPKGWDVVNDVIEIDGVLYTHGTGLSGKNAALNLSLIKGMSVVMGHVHGFGGVQWRRNKHGMFFGLNVGCGVDEDSYAMEYAKAFPNSPTLGCGIVQDGKQGIFIPMEE